MQSVDSIVPEVSPQEKPSVQIGETFNPWRGACGFYPPDVVGRLPSRALTDGQKRLYERLVRYAGRDGRCFPAQETLARELGKTERQVRRDLERLEAYPLVKSVARDGRRGNTYLFLWHPIFEESRRTVPVECAVDRTSMSAQSGDGQGPDRTSTSGQTPAAADLSAVDRTSTADLTGHPRPGNSVQEFSTVKERASVVEIPEESRPPASTPPQPEPQLDQAVPAQADKPIWPEMFIPIREAMREHARAISQEAKLEADADLVRRIAQVSVNPRAEAALISKISLRRFGEFVPEGKRQPWPESLVYWVTVIREEFGRSQASGTGPAVSPPRPATHRHRDERPVHEAPRVQRPGLHGFASAAEIIAGMGYQPNSAAPVPLSYGRV